MEQDRREPSGDYGYDMAHQDVAQPAPRPAPPRDAAPPREPAGRDDTAGEDLGYDEAHDF